MALNNFKIIYFSKKSKNSGREKKELKKKITLWVQQKNYKKILMNRPQGNNVEERKTLWVGDVQTWMDESYLRSLFSKTGHIQSVKIMRDKATNQPVGYGFVEFSSHEVAAKVLQLFTGSINPATNKPFKLNWGVYGGSNNAPTLPMSSKNVPVYRGSHHPDGPFSSTSRLGAKLSGTIENKVSVSWSLGGFLLTFF